MKFYYTRSRRFVIGVPLDRMDVSNAAEVRIASRLLSGRTSGDCAGADGILDIIVVK